jgi:hypothetical protein
VLFDRALVFVFNGQFLLSAFDSGLAKLGDRTDQALGIFRQTDSCAEFHQGLVVLARSIMIQERIGDQSETPLTLSRKNVGVVVFDPAEDPENVAVYYSMR